MRRNRYKTLRLGDKRTLAKKLSFTFLMIALFKLLSFVPAPFVNMNAVRELTESLSIFQTAELFSGQAISYLTLMATGISSYITASIIIQLLTFSFPRLNEISKSSNGEKTIKRITMVLGITLAVITSLAFTLGFSRENPAVLTNHSWYAYAIIAITHALGTAIAILIGQAIEKKGYGNGVSLLIAVNVVSAIPSMITSLTMVARQNIPNAIGILLFTLFMITIIIVVESSERKIPVTYTKIAARGNGHMAHKKQTLPLKINPSGVMPIIIASTLLQVFTFLGRVSGVPFLVKVSETLLEQGSIAFGLTMSILIVLFTFMYSTIIFDPAEISDNLQKNGGAILGVRPGRDTKNYLTRVNKGLTRISAMYLLIVSLIPVAISLLFNFSGIQATSLMIIVGVSLDVIIKLTNEHSLSKMKL